MAEAFEGHYLSGICRCGLHVLSYVELPAFIEVSGEGSTYHLKPAEHVIVKCPRCSRLLNVGNGRQRGKKRKEKEA